MDVHCVLCTPRASYACPLPLCHLNPPCCKSAVCESSKRTAQHNTTQHNLLRHASYDLINTFTCGPQFVASSAQFSGFLLSYPIRPLVPQSFPLQEWLMISCRAVGCTRDGGSPLRQEPSSLLDHLTTKYENRECRRQTSLQEFEHACVVFYRQPRPHLYVHNLDRLLNSRLRSSLVSGDMPVATQ
jgi:hypothetical protein